MLKKMGRDNFFEKVGMSLHANFNHKTTQQRTEHVGETSVMCVRVCALVG